MTKTTHMEDIILSVKSLLTAFGGSIRFGNPPEVGRKGDTLAGAGFSGGVPMVHLTGPGGDRYRDFRKVERPVAEDVRGILRRCLVPENIRLRRGDIIRVRRYGGEVYGVLTDTEGVVFHVDCRGCLLDRAPALVIFGEDDIEVAGHVEFIKGVFDTETPEEAYGEFAGVVSRREPIPFHCKTYPFPGGGSALEAALGKEGVTPAARGTVVEYKGIEALVYRDGEESFRVHPVYACRPCGTADVVTKRAADTAC